jgi:hypothetical protein
MKKLQAIELGLEEEEDLKRHGLTCPECVALKKILLKEELRLVGKAQKRMEYVSTKANSKEDAELLKKFSEALVKITKRGA